MNRLVIIGNLTHDPDMRVVGGDKTVCTFNVAVNRRGRDGADFFRVSAWGKMGDNCSMYLSKGRKVAVTGSVSASAYTAQDGSARASIEVYAHEVEFLTPKNQQYDQTDMPTNDYTIVEDNNLPF